MTTETHCLELALDDEADGRWASVEVAYHPGEPARTWGRPDDWHPGDPGWWEPVSVVIRNGWDVVAIPEGEELARWLRDHEQAIEELAVARLELIL